MICVYVRHGDEGQDNLECESLSSILVEIGSLWLLADPYISGDSFSCLGFPFIFRILGLQMGAEVLCSLHLCWGLRFTSSCFCGSQLLSFELFYEFFSPVANLSVPFKLLLQRYLVLST